jgi:hypothetical protein
MARLKEEEEVVARQTKILGAISTHNHQYTLHHALVYTHTHI